MKIFSKYKRQSLIAFCLILVSCVSYSCCGQSLNLMSSTKDATHIKRDSFVLVEITQVLTLGKCTSIEGCQDVPNEIRRKEFHIRGSGAVIAHREGLTYVLTAQHVCEQDDAPKNVTLLGANYEVNSETIINFSDIRGAAHKGNVVYADKENDICIVSSPGMWGSPARIAKEMPRPGEKVYNIAAPYGIYSPGMSLTFEGFYSGRDMRGNEFYTVPARPGSSGSAIFNSSGEIIGVVHSAMINFEHLAISCRLENIVDAYQSHVPSQRLSIGVGNTYNYYHGDYIAVPKM